MGIQSILHWILDILGRFAIGAIGPLDSPGQSPARLGAASLFHSLVLVRRVAPGTWSADPCGAPMMKYARDFHKPSAIKLYKTSILNVADFWIYYWVHQIVWFKTPHNTSDIHLPMWYFPSQCRESQMLLRKSSISINLWPALFRV